MSARPRGTWVCARYVPSRFRTNFSCGPRPDPDCAKPSFPVRAALSSGDGTGTYYPKSRLRYCNWRSMRGCRASACSLRSR